MTGPGSAASDVRAQFEQYPDLDPGSSELAEVIGEDAYALTPSYTVIRVEGLRSFARFRMQSTGSHASPSTFGAERIPVRNLLQSTG